MRREKARLEELRSMSYAEYLESPEWQKTQIIAMKWAKNQCQGCDATGVILTTYHTNLENLGCELEGDVLTLCEGCYDRFYQSGKLAVQGDTTETDEEENYPNFSFGKKIAVFGSSALVAMGLPALLHAPLPAELFGLAAAVALAANSPKIYNEMRESLPQPLVELLDGMIERKQEREASGEWSTIDRLLGRHMREENVSLRIQDEDKQGKESQVDEEPDWLVDRDYLDLGPTLKPHADSMLSGRKVILGTSGSGKTNTMNVYCEELAKLDPAPAIILFDTDDENRALCNQAYLPNPLWLDKSRSLTVENAFQMAQKILEHRYQCIINLQSYEDEEAAWIMINMVKGVRAWQEAREVRIPCEIVLDEASVWLPQNTRESVLSSIMVDDPDAPEDYEDDQTNEKDKGNKRISLLALLQRAFFSTVVRRGRRRGMGFTLAAQRIAEIDKRALQGSWMFLMRQTQPADFREYQKFGISSDEAIKLLDGEAFVFAPGKPRERHRLRESNSPHGGVTPGMKALRGSTKREVAPTPVTRKQSETIREPLPQRAASNESVRPRLALVREEVASNSGNASMRGIPLELREAVRVYRPGMSYRDLGRELGRTDGEARVLWQEMKARGLLNVNVAHQAEPLLLAANGNNVPTYQASPEIRSNVPGTKVAPQGREQRIQLGKDVFLSQQQFAVALNLRKTGMSTGYRDLMPVFDLSEHHAKELNKRIRQALGQRPERESE